MGVIKRNIIANYAGSTWNALMSVILIPVCIKFIGIEAYGLVGIFASLLAWFSVLDFGLSATMTREMARFSTLDPTGKDARCLGRTLEVIYWTVALFLGLIVIILAGPIATHWVKPQRLEPHVVKQALMIMGGVIALRWPVSFYSGGLRGLERQPLLNAIRSGGETLRAIGAGGVLWLVSSTIQAYFWSQIFAGAIEAIALATAFRLSLPSAIEEKAVFDWRSVNRVWRFSAGLTGITAMTLLLTQTDKLILSRMLSLERFGYYSLAWTVSGALLYFIMPVETAVYPSFIRLAAQSERLDFSRIYHKSSQMVSIVLAPAALLLVLFGDSVLSVWLGDAEIVRNTAPLLSILGVGTFLNGLMHVPYAAQLAYGWTGLAFWQNGVSVFLFVPLLFFLIQRWQETGAAAVWVILNAGYFLISIPVMHRRILSGLKRDWYFVDVGLPTLAALGVISLGRIIVPREMSMMGTVCYLATVAFLSFSAAVLAAPLLRNEIMKAAMKRARSVA